MPAIRARFTHFLKEFLTRKHSLSVFKFFLCYFPFLIPVRRVFLGKYTLAFFHPQPAYPFHIILLPRSGASALVNLTPEDKFFLQECFLLIPRLIQDYALSVSDYQLILNGGQFQQFPIIHFHLVSQRSTHA